MIDFTSILLALLTYVIATASPGPATLAIMAASAGHGRPAGLQLAAGVMTGSLFWGICAAFGLATLMSQHAELFLALKIAGGLYLFWLAVKSFRSAFSQDAPGKSHNVTQKGRFYAQGLAIHLTNPKAVLAWIAIFAIGVQANSSAWHVGVLLLGCALLGVCIFFGYALLFSTSRAQKAYVKAKRPLNILLGGIFGAAGLKLVLEPN